MNIYIICLKTNGNKYAYQLNDGTIKPYQFYGDDTLVSISIGKGITSIGDFAFSNCPNLKYVRIADSVFEIGESAFENCSSLKTIYCQSNNFNYGDNALANVGSNGKLYYDGEGQMVQDIWEFYYEFLQPKGWKYYSRNSLNWENVTLGETPVRIEQNNGSNILEPLKPYSCTISLVTPTIYKDMYSPTAQGVNCKVMNESNNEMLFYGYVTPCAYNQEWETVADELELECISPISSLEYFKYKNNIAESENNSLEDIIKHCLAKSNYYDSFYFPNNYEIEGVEAKKSPYDEDRVDNFILGNGNIAYKTDFKFGTSWDELEVMITTPTSQSNYGSEVILSDYDGITDNVFELRIDNVIQDTTPNYVPLFVLRTRKEQITPIKPQYIFFNTKVEWGHTYKMFITNFKWVVTDMTLNETYEMTFDNPIYFDGYPLRPLYIGCLDKDVDFRGKWHHVRMSQQGIVSHNYVPYCTDATNNYHEFYDSVVGKIIYNTKGNRNELSHAVWDEEETDTTFLKNIYMNENNFFDDDDEHTPWSCKAVLEEFCKFMGVSLTEHNVKLYFIDYNAISNGNNSFINYANNDAVSLANNITIDENLYRDGGTNVSYDEVYNKISIKDNFYEQKSFVLNLFEGTELIHKDTDYITNHWESEDGIVHYDLWRYYHNPNYTFQFYYPRRYEETTYNGVRPEPYTMEQIMEWLYLENNVQYNEYLDKWFPSKWSFEKDGILTLPHYDGSVYRNWTYCGDVYNLTDKIEDRLQVLNRFHIGAWILKNMNFEHDPKQSWGNTTLPKGYDWNDIICFSYGTYNMYNADELHKYIRENNLQVIKIKQVNNLVWSTKDSDVYFNYRGSVMNTHAGSGIFNDDAYKGGFHLGRKPCWKLRDDWSYDDEEVFMSGEYYYGGYSVDVEFSKATVPMTRYMVPVSFTGGTNMLNNWLPMIENCTFEMNIGSQDGYVNWLPSVVDTRGDLEFALCAPSAFVRKWNTQNSTYAFVKDFEFNICSSSGSKAKLEIDDEEDDDVIYTGPIDQDYALEFDDVELKINTQIEDRNFSYSSIIYRSTNGVPYYLNELKDLTIDKNQIQEYNLVEKYYNHFSTPKMMLDGTFDAVIKPYSILTENNLEKKFCVDGYEFDVRKNNMTTKLVEY